jgi:hypothetical protein
MAVDAVMQGEVQWRSIFLKRWQSRYMVVTPEALAFYQSSSKKRECCKLPRGQIVRVGALDTPESGKHCLELQTKWRRFVVATDSAMERDSWLEVFGVQAQKPPKETIPEKRVLGDRFGAHVKKGTDGSAQRAASNASSDSDGFAMLEAEVLSDLQEILFVPAAKESLSAARHLSYAESLGAVSNNPSRRRAATALLQMRPVLLHQCVSLLCQLAASDSDPEVRKLAVIGLGTVPKKDAQEVLPILLNSMSDTSPDVRFHAAESLRHFGLNANPAHISALQDSLQKNDGD